MDGDFEHQIVEHLTTYVDGQVHTNGLENFWSLLKRGVGGTYVSVEPYHLFRYVDEQAFRFNNRKHADGALQTGALSDRWKTVDLQGTDREGGALQGSFLSVRRNVRGDGREFLLSTAAIRIKPGLLLVFLFSAAHLIARDCEHVPHCRNEPRRGFRPFRIFGRLHETMLPYKSHSDMAYSIYQEHSRDYGNGSIV